MIKEIKNIFKWMIISQTAERSKEKIQLQFYYPNSIYKRLVVTTLCNNCKFRKHFHANTSTPDTSFRFTFSTIEERKVKNFKMKFSNWKKKKEKKEREIKRTSETPIFLNEQPWNKFEPLPSDRTAARHHRRNLCRTIRRHFRNCSGAFLNFRRKSKVTRPCGQFQGSAYVWHVPRSLSRIFQPLQLQGWREAERRWWRKRIPSLSLLLLLLLSLYHSSSICAALRRSMKLVNRTWSPWPRVDQS